MFILDSLTVNLFNSLLPFFPSVEPIIKSASGTTSSRALKEVENVVNQDAGTLSQGVKILQKETEQERNKSKLKRLRFFV